MLDPTQEFQAVLFDLDGTLVDSGPVVERSWRVWAEEYAVDPARLVGVHGVPAAVTIAELLPDDLHDEAYARILDLEVTGNEGVRALPGAAEAMSRLNDAGASVAIVTSGSGVLARSRLEATGIRVPSVLVTVDDIERGKPDPQPFLRAAELLGVEPERCLAVEDTVPGLRSARAAGVGATLAVTTTSPASELEPYADVIVGTLAEVSFIASDDVVLVDHVAPDA